MRCYFVFEMLKQHSSILLSSKKWGKYGYTIEKAQQQTQNCYKLTKN